MKTATRTLLILAVCSLTACVAMPPAAPTPAPTSIPLHVEAGDYTRIDFPPDARPTEETPQLTVHGVIVNKATNERLIGNVYMDDQQMLSGVDEFNLVLPRSYEGWMRVSVPGYHEWKVRIRHNINHSKMMQAPVLMTPVTEPLPTL